MLKYLWHDIEKGVRKYIPFLEELEDGLYDSKGKLCEELLIQRVQKNPQWTLQAANRTVASLGLKPPELPVLGKGNITCTSREFASNA